MLNSEEMIKNLEKQVAEIEKPQEIVQEPVPQESLIPKEPENDDEDNLPDEPKGNEAWINMRHAQKRTKEKLKTIQAEKEQADKQLQELRERLARLEGREEVRQKPVEEIKDPEPDRTLDPDAWKEWKIAQQDKKLAELEAKVQQTSAMSEIEGSRRGMNKLEQAYKSTGVVDYDDRINFMMDAEKARIKLLYPQATETQIDSHLESEKFRLANEALAQGRNPAEMFYKMAETYGYRKETKEKETPKPDIAALSKNMEKTVNLIGSSGAEKSGGITPNQIFQSTLQGLVGKSGDIEKLIKKLSVEQ